MVAVGDHPSGNHAPRRVRAVRWGAVWQWPPSALGPRWFADLTPSVLSLALYNVHVTSAKSRWNEFAEIIPYLGFAILRLNYCRTDRHMQLSTDNVNGTRYAANYRSLFHATFDRQQSCQDFIRRFTAAHK